jgi:DNA-binding NtrC family response regulator
MGLSAPVHQLFMRYRWPGNVRELENVIERAVIVAKGREIELADLPEPLRNSVADTTDFVVPPNYTLAEIEKMAIVQTLERTKGNKMEAAEMLGVYRPTLYSKIKKYRLQKDTPASS